MTPPPPSFSFAPLKSKVVVIDPGHGHTQETFRQGPKGEREEWINLRVALLLEKYLLQRGAKPLLTRRTDVDVPLAQRVKLTLSAKADLFVSIHHNSSDPVDPLLNHPSVFIHDAVNKSSPNQSLAFCLGKQFSKARKMDTFIDSDQILFKEGLYVLRRLHGQVPAILGEYSFFSHPEEEERLQRKEYCQQEAHAYLVGIKDFLSVHSTNCSMTSSPSPLFPESLRTLYMKRRQALLTPATQTKVDQMSPSSRISQDSQVSQTPQNSQGFQGSQASNVSKTSVEKMSISWRSYFDQAQELAKQGDFSLAQQEFLNSLALLRNHPEFLTVFQFLAQQGLAPLSSGPALRHLVAFQDIQNEGFGEKIIKENTNDR